MAFTVQRPEVVHFYRASRLPKLVKKCIGIELPGLGQVSRPITSRYHMSELMFHEVRLSVVEAGGLVLLGTREVD